jgi:hypothetical protein
VPPTPQPTCHARHTPDSRKPYRPLLMIAAKSILHETRIVVAIAAQKMEFFVLI